MTNISIGCIGSFISLLSLLFNRLKDRSGLLAILLAFVIGIKQINISNRQIDQTNRQFEVDGLRYTMDVILHNRNELLTKIITLDGKIYREQDADEKIKLYETFRDNEKAMMELDKKWNLVSTQYNNSVKSKPKDFTVR